MALRACRECKTEISSRAKVCPACGLKKPHQHPIARGINSLANMLMVVGLLITVLGVVGTCIFAG